MWVLSCVLSRAIDLKRSCRQRGGLSGPCLWVFMAHPLVSQTYAPQCVWCANGGVEERGGIILSHCFLAVNFHHLLSIYSISGCILSCSV